MAGGLIGFQDDKLPPAERKARTLSSTGTSWRPFVGAKNGDFGHLLD